jgi:tetratricopeptide (TPR) repeat protein
MHTDVAGSYNSIGKVYDLQGEYHKALEAFEKALEIRYQIFGANHALVNDLANSVYSVYQKLLPQDASILPRYEEFMKNIASIATINEDK